VCTVYSGRRKYTHYIYGGGTFDAKQLNRKRVNTRQRDSMQQKQQQRYIGGAVVEVPLYGYIYIYIYLSHITIIYIYL